MQYVYVVHYDAPEWCRRTVDSLLGSEADLAVVVVDNGGRALQLPPSVSVLRNPVNTGFAGGANVAVADWWTRADASGPFAVCCHDVLLAPGSLLSASTLMAADAKIGVVAPRAEQSGKVAGGSEECSTQFPGVGSVSFRTWVPGTCMIIRAECLREVRGFDASFGSYVEDVDLCLRARDAGWRVARMEDYVAAGEGSASGSWRLSINVNTVRLALLREGRRGAVRQWIAHLVFGISQIVRGIVSRTPELRSRGLTRLLALPAAARLIVRDPPRRVPVTSRGVG